MLPTQPLEVKDFSGGITDNILQGDMRRYEKADNLLITNDHKLVVRPGFIYFNLADSDQQLPSGNRRVNGMYAILNETKLLAQSARNLYVYEGSSLGWVAPTSTNEPVQGGDTFGQTTIAEFQNQIYLTSDGGDGENGSLPSKLYRDDTNTWVVRTAGLPRAYTSNTYSNNSLLSACLTLANALRTSMISHMADSKNTNYTALNLSTYNPQGNLNLHENRDKYSLQYLQTETFVSTDAETNTATPAPAATSLATLLTLVRALNLAYTHHMRDSTVGSTIQSPVATGQLILAPNTKAPYYHPYLRFFSQTSIVTPLVPVGPAIDLVDTTLPTTLAQAAIQLDDLRQKWQFHRLAINTHSFNNDYTFMNRYAVSAAKIGTIQTTTNNSGDLILKEKAVPTVTPDFTDLYNYVNNIRQIYTGHIYDSYTENTALSLPAHGQVNSSYNTWVQQVNTNLAFDSSTAVNADQLPNCTDLDSMYLLIYWLRCKYNDHWQDAHSPFNSQRVLTAGTYFHLGITFTTVAATTALTNVVSTTTGLAITLAPGTWIYGVRFDPKANSRTAPVSSLAASYICQVVSSASGTATVDRNATFSTTTNYAGASGSKYHVYQNSAYTTTATQYLDSLTAVDTSTNQLATSATATGSSLQGWLDLADELFLALGSHANDPKIHLGTPSLSWTYYIANTTNQFFMPDIATVSYAFYYSDPYTVETGGIFYLTKGNPVYTVLADIAISYPVGYSIPSKNTAFYPAISNVTTRSNVISNLPTLTNDHETNYDTSDSYINIYRTVDNGTVWYKLARLTNGTLTYTDSVNDDIAPDGGTVLNTNEQIYTTGGVVGYDQPPQSKFVHIVNGTAFYAGITDTSQYFPNRIIQAVQFAPDAAPATFYDDFDDEITGLSSARSQLIVFCKSSIFRESGGFTAQGQGSLIHDKISDVVGCVNSKSIVQTEVGVFFAGQDGFYYTDGYQVIKISLEIDQTYSGLVRTDAQKRNIYGAYDKVTRRVWWAMRENPSQDEHSVIFVYYLNYGIKPSGVFTKVFNNDFLFPSSCVFKNGTLYVGHKNGYIFNLDENTKTDPVATLGSANREVIPYNYTSCAIDSGTIYKRKWITKIHLVGDNSGNASITPYVIRDKNFDDDGLKAMSDINYNDNLTWGDPTIVWNDAITWDNTGKMDVWRRFPQTTLRSDFIQISLRPASNVAVYASTVKFPEGANTTVDSTAKTATIITPAGYTAIIWPLDVVGMSITFAYDSYATSYTITNVSTNVITFSDSGNTSLTVISPGTGWMIKGTRKEQRPTITGYVLHFAMLGDKNQAYPGAKSTGGRGNGGEN